MIGRWFRKLENWIFYRRRPIVKIEVSGTDLECQYSKVYRRSLEENGKEEIYLESICARYKCEMMVHDSTTICLVFNSKKHYTMFLLAYGDVL
jgi:hypothetical protein